MRTRLEAVRKVLSDDRFKAHYLTVIETGRMKESLRTSFRSLVYPTTVGRHDDLTDQELVEVLGQSAVFVYPSSFEGFGL